jgi:hypothetical protein
MLAKNKYLCQYFNVNSRERQTWKRIYILCLFQLSISSTSFSTSLFIFPAAQKWLFTWRFLISFYINFFPFQFHIHPLRYSLIFLVIIICHCLSFGFRDFPALFLSHSISISSIHLLVFFPIKNSLPLTIFLLPFVIYFFFKKKKKSSWWWLAVTEKRSTQV